jgi:A/G-specific adenine glycosylase
MHKFLLHIYKWYKSNSRDLPWRHTNDPYKIWVSEIILQQTRVNQGMAYYEKFIEKFPDIQHLAAAKEDVVLKLWQGLGYYSRARNMHAAAKYIVSHHDGKFPENYSEILQLKGVGPYTAGIIASIAFGLSFPALDGNVYRVLSRYFGISDSPDTAKGKKEFMKIARAIMPENDPGFHNQALMEFGALQCLPKSPACAVCPLAPGCFAYSHNHVERFPAKREKAKQRIRYFYYYFIESEHHTWLEKRTKNDIWKNLYQFPLLETEKPLQEQEILTLVPAFLYDCQFNLKSVSVPQKHILSHQIIYARLIRVEVNTGYRPGNRFIRMGKNELTSLAVPRLVERMIKKTGIFGKS